MKTAAKVTVIKVTMHELRTEVRAFEDAHHGYDRTNYLDLFRDERGELVETDEFFRIARIYHRLERAEKIE